MSAFFPQLRPGTALQYPLRKALNFRTVVHPQDLVTPLRSADDGATRAHWQVQLRGLSDAELESLQELFATARGPYGSFVFLDPEGNLLARSEDLLHPTWQRSANLLVTGGVTPPPIAKAAFALQAGSGTAAEIWQSLALPTSYHWLLSVYVRSLVPGESTLFLRSQFGEHTLPIALTPAWQRYSVSASGWPAGMGIDAGLRLPSGGSADVTGYQLETQTAPSAYKSTLQRSGVFTEARFEDDHLRVNTLAPNCHQVNLRIVAPFAG